MDKETRSLVEQHEKITKKFEDLAEELADKQKLPKIKRGVFSKELKDDLKENIKLLKSLVKSLDDVKHGRVHAMRLPKD